jgi:hypothetical protein
MTGYPWLVLISIAVALLFTWLLLIDAVVRGRSKGKTAQLAAAYRRFSPSGDLPSRNRRVRLYLLVLAVLVILNVVALWLLLSQGPGNSAEESTSNQRGESGGLSPTASPSPTPAPQSGSAEGEAIELEDLADSAMPFQPVRIRGTYRGGADTFLRVQRWEGGRWLDFPIPAKTNQSGEFTTYVELGQPGRYRLRVVEPNSGVTSKPFELVIKS